MECFDFQHAWHQEVTKLKSRVTKRSDMPAETIVRKSMW